MTILSGTLARRFVWWLLSLAWAGLIYFLSAQPDTTFQKLGLSGELLSVASHFFVYAMLMVFLSAALRSDSAIPTSRRRQLAFLIVAVYAVTDEYHQSFVPGRTATLFDWLTDLAGALTAWAILARWKGRYSLFK